MAITFEKEKFTQKEKKILGYLSVLDQHSGNILKASKKLKISRPTLMKYRELYWDKYLETKELVYKKDLDITKKSIEDAVMLSVTEEKLTGLLDLICKRMEVILNDPDLVKKVSFKSLTVALSAILPYLQAKKGESEEKSNTHASTTVLERIQGAMNRAKEAGIFNIQNNINIQTINANGEDQNSIQRDCQGNIESENC